MTMKIKFRSTKPLPNAIRTVTKHVTVALLAFLLGVGLNISRVYAESKAVNVPGIGNVGTAETTGNATAGTKGRSTATNNLYYLRAHIRIWHTGNILQSQNNKTWNWNKGGWTNQISSSGFGDYSVTLHTFQFTPSNATTTTYTSQSGGWSCSNAWNQYQNGTC